MDFGIRISEFGIRNSAFGFRFSDFGIRISDFGFWISDLNRVFDIEDRAWMRMRMMHPDRHTWGRSAGGCRSIWDWIQTGNDKTNDARGVDMLGDNRCSRGFYCSLSMFYV